MQPKNNKSEAEKIKITEKAMSGPSFSEIKRRIKDLERGEFYTLDELMEKVKEFEDDLE